MKIKSLICVILLLFTSYQVECQETVFSLLKSEMKLADQYFNRKDYKSALLLYLNIARKNSSVEVELKIARAHHFLKQHQKSVAAYEKWAIRDKLPLTDLLYFAESQSGISNYSNALETYQSYLSRVPDDELVLQKIWRLSNIQYLYEDSSYYSVKPVPVNTEFGDLCAVPYRNGLVFMSNRKEVQPIEKIDAGLRFQFYRLYFSSVGIDTSQRDALHFQRPVVFSKDLNPKFHVGPLAFFDNDQKMIFTTTAAKGARNGRRTLQLYFAEYSGGDWKITSAFPHNSTDYSITDPYISDDGKLLYFASDMKGGFGGKDLYKSELVNNEWTRPTNLGEQINTAHDEVFPFFHDNTLYFSSNGHPGLGGLDIFRTESFQESFSDIQNIGYPLNTSFDDFGITFDSLGAHGYFSSNRQSGGYNDDIYEFEMDLQRYPLEVNGVLKFKEHSWSDSLDLKIMPNAKLYLVDHVRDITVFEGTTDSLGNFTVVVPHHSKYKIRVIGEGLGENIVSLEIPKHRRTQGDHEIVVVKDLFKED